MNKKKEALGAGFPDSKSVNPFFWDLKPFLLEEKG